MKKNKTVASRRCYKATSPAERWSARLILKDSGSALNNVMGPSAVHPPLASGDRFWTLAHTVSRRRWRGKPSMAQV